MSKILIAEDSATAVELIKRTLSPLGHEIVIAADGEKAEKMILDEKPDLLVLDIIMPRMNGFQLCRSLRATPGFEDLPVIMITSMDRDSDRYWGLKQGATEYLIKPVDPDLLLERVKAYLPAVA